MRNCVQTDEMTPEARGNVAVQPLFGQTNGCDRFEQRVLRVGPEPATVDGNGGDDVLYVLEGHGTATIDGSAHALEPGTCVHVPHGRTVTLAAADGDLRVLSVVVRDPEPSSSRGSVVQIDRRDAGRATAGRQFALGVGPEHGCASVTQFVGFVPPGRAPDHFHRYDEVVYVLEGEGTLHIDGEHAPLRPGSAVHLPAKLVHSLENTGPGELHVLGVFRPAGSPAEAYYPDGTLASVPEEE
jgi:mannose-6-phosphate isomerase-like protein (cupin superfamily)